MGVRADGAPRDVQPVEESHDHRRKGESRYAIGSRKSGSCYPKEGGEHNRIPGQRSSPVKAMGLSGNACKARVIIRLHDISSHAAFAVPWGMTYPLPLLTRSQRRSSKPIIRKQALPPQPTGNDHSARGRSGTLTAASGRDPVSEPRKAVISAVCSFVRSRASWIFAMIMTAFSSRSTEPS
jgi:hypothetical protein